jgi:RNA-directed DNA polymerase
MSASKIFKKYFSLNQLNNTFETYIKHNTAVGIDRMTYKRFSEQKDLQFKIIKQKVLNGTYRFTPYKEKLIVKDRNSYPRLISIPTIRDKVVLKSLHLVLAEIFNTIKQPLPQKCIQEIKENICKYDSFVKLDISNFYGTIKHGILLDKLQNKIRKNEILSLIKKAITTPTVRVGESNSKELITEGLPQGLPISNILAHIYLNDLDNKFANKTNIKYIRYVDDMIILCSKRHIDNVFREIKYELEAIYNLNLNHDKIKIGSIVDGFDFLGYTVKKLKNGKIGLTVKETSKRNFEDSIVRIFTKYKYSDKMSPKQFIFTLNNKITGSISSKVDGDESKQFKYGWLFYFSQIDDTGLLYHLDWFVKEKLLKKFKFDHINKDEIKSFVKAFYEIRYNVKKSNYIHRPDELTFEEKKELLNEIFNIPINRLSSKDAVEKLYYKFVYKPIKEYEKDIQNLIS